MKEIKQHNTSYGVTTYKGFVVSIYQEYNTINLSADSYVELSKFVCVYWNKISKQYIKYNSANKRLYYSYHL